MSAAERRAREQLGDAKVDEIQAYARQLAAENAPMNTEDLVDRLRTQFPDVAEPMLRPTSGGFSPLLRPTSGGFGHRRH